MRINIMIDKQLMTDALEVTGAKSEQEAIEMGLRALVQLTRQERIRGFRGKLKWSGDLEHMRTDGPVTHRA